MQKTLMIKRFLQIHQCTPNKYLLHRRDKTSFLSFKQEGDMLILDDKILNIIDDFTILKAILINALERYTLLSKGY